MFLSPSGEKNRSHADGNSSPRAMPSSSKLLVGVAPINDENLQNYKIQVAVNRYNSRILPPFQQSPFSAYKCSIIRAKSPRLNYGSSSECIRDGRVTNLPTMSRSRQLRSESLPKSEDLLPCEEVSTNLFPKLAPHKQRFMKRPAHSAFRGEGPPMQIEKPPSSPELRYTGPEHFPTCHIYRSPFRSAKKQNILSQLNAHSGGLPASRFLDDSAEKYSDLKSTRSVLDVLQDMSRKRMHGKDDGVDGIKKRFKGLGGDLVQEGESTYKPLFVPKGRNSSLPRKDQTTQTEKSSKGETSETPSLDDPKSELRKKLAKKNNEIAASLSSSARGFVFTKRKRGVETFNEKNSDSCMGEEGVAKKQRFSDVNKSLPGSLLNTPILRKEKKTPSVETSPNSPTDRLMSIYLDLQNESDAKLNAIKSINSCPGGTQFVRPVGTPDETDTVAVASVKSSLGAFEPLFVSASAKQKSVTDETKNTPASPSSSLGISALSKPFGATPVVSAPVVGPTSVSDVPKTTPVAANFNFQTLKALEKPTVIASSPKVTSEASPVQNIGLQFKKGSTSGLSAAALPTTFSIPTTANFQAVGNVSSSFTPPFSNLTGSSVASVASTTTAMDTPITSATQQEKDKTPQLKITGGFNLTPTTSKPPTPASPIGVSFQPSTPTIAPALGFGSNVVTPPKSTPFSFGKSPSTPQPVIVSSVESSAMPTATIASPVLKNTHEKSSVSAAIVSTPNFSFGNSTTISSPFSFGLTKPVDSKPAVFSFGTSSATNTDPRLESRFYVPQTEAASVSPTLITTPDTVTSANAPITLTSSASVPAFSFGQKPISAATNMLGDKPASASATLLNNTAQADSTTGLSTDTKLNENSGGSSPKKWSFGTSTASGTASTSGFATPVGTTVEVGTPKTDAKPSVFARLGVPLAKEPFSFGKTSSDASSTPATTAAQKQFGGFAFGRTHDETTTSTAPSATPAFSFGKTDEKSGTAFGTSTVTTNATNIFPAYGTGVPAVSAVTTITANVTSSFGTSSPATTTGFGFASGVPAFKVGSSTTTTASQLPAFPQTVTTASSFSITSATPDLGQTTAMGQSATSTATFGKTAPIFGAGAEQKTSAGFGTNPTTTPAFTFGKTATTTGAQSIGESIPVFAFGSNAKSGTFGSQTPFGSSASAAPASATQTTAFGATPAFGSTATPQQSFGSGFSQSSGVFGQVAPAAFGQPKTTSATTAAFTFGKNATSSTTPFSFGKAATTSASLFGGGSSVTTSAFGSAAPGTMPSFGAATKETTPAFGASSTGTTSVFGAKSTGTTPAFGAASTGTTPTFGAAANATTPAFGTAASATTQAFGASATGNTSVFGTAVPGTALAFGAGSTGTTPAFGSASLGTTSPFGAAATGPFGSSTATPSFGNTPVTTASSSGGSLFTFGASQLNKPTSSVFNFGSTSTNPTPPTQPTPFAFGNSSLPPSGFNFSAGASAAGNNFSFGSSSNASNVSFGQTAAPAFGQNSAPSPGGFSPFAQAPAAGAFVPGTFSIGAGSSQSRSRLPARSRRR